ncbi:MAG: DegT/DnrJ/EryC1/StrS family aminotransferase, partial [Burkholderiales bacterium]|nr:DegT/DnrJ/EryC1/StrS family aminotransferase [Burkholderiales bacterium]
IAFDRIGTTRHAFMKRLREKGIVAQVHYIPVHFHPYYAPNGNRKGEFPHAENYYEEALSLPLYYGLSNDEQNLVIESINDLVK